MSDSQKPSISTTNALNELIVIRDILFGEQMRSYEERFAQHETRMEEMQAEFDKQLRRTQSEFERRLTELQETLTQRLDALAYEKAARHQLGDLLIQMGEAIKRDDD
ncbi:MAG: DUF1917 domain-containing protein [Chloroflexi bacterium]|nr:DUF1917 domain-containing protein [Chloroflexota bacterium]